MYQNYIFDLYGTLADIHTGTEPIGQNVEATYCVEGGDFTRLSIVLHDSWEIYRQFHLLLVAFLLYV